MKTKVYLGGALLVGSLFFAGCSNEIPELSENQQEQIVEYAAGIVRKYDQNHTIKLKSLEETQQVIQAQIEVQQALEELRAQEKEQSALQPDSEVTVVDTPQTIEATMESMLNSEVASITYAGYDIKDFYPDTADGMYFLMNATIGNKLLVVKFTVQNNSGADTMLDVIGTGSRFRIQVNGESKNALTTMLLNDLANYQGTISAGGSEELVLVCEIPEAQADSIESLALNIRNEGGTATISLY